MHGEEDDQFSNRWAPPNGNSDVRTHVGTHAPAPVRRPPVPLRVWAARLVRRTLNWLLLLQVRMRMVLLES